METQVETLIIGGGQGGLSVSYFLQQAQREHLVLDAADQPANAWRNDRWDSFYLNSPNWSFRLPGAGYSGSEPDGFMARDQVVAAFEHYIDHYQLPVRFGVRARSIEWRDPGFRVETEQETFLARDVVVATGMYQSPKVPSFAMDLNGNFQVVASGQYRNPEALPSGAILVVGSAQSGCQIAEELYQSGRKVYLCVGSAGRVPRRYRGRDIFEWLERSGFWSRTPAQLPTPQARFSANPQVSGTQGGHSLNLHQFYRDGVTLLGRLRDIQGHCLILASDLHENLHKADQLEQNILNLVDDYIARNNIEAPPEQIPVLKDAYQSPEIERLDLKDAGITTVIWALGYHFDFSQVKLPVFDSFGFPISTDGGTSYSGLYFCGLPWIPCPKTGLLLGVAEQAATVAKKITG